MKLYIIVIGLYALLSLYNENDLLADTPLTPYDKCMILYGDTIQATQCDLLR